MHHKVPYEKVPHPTVGRGFFQRAGMGTWFTRALDVSNFAQSSL